jgi:hypothetical protein
VTLCYHGAYGMGEKYDALKPKGENGRQPGGGKILLSGGEDLLRRAVLWTDTGFACMWIPVR